MLRANDVSVILKIDTCIVIICIGIFEEKKRGFSIFLTVLKMQFILVL